MREIQTVVRTTTGQTIESMWEKLDAPDATIEKVSDSYANVICNDETLALYLGPDEVVIVRTKTIESVTLKGRG